MESGSVDYSKCVFTGDEAALVTVTVRWSRNGVETKSSQPLSAVYCSETALQNNTSHLNASH